MLTDSQILDEKTQSLDAVLEELEAVNADSPAGPTSSTVRDVMNDENLQVTIECMGTLVDLYHTVSQEGVSLYDIQALRSVQNRMSAIAELNLPKVALERFEGMFTEDRTMLNQRISVESIVTEIGRVIKEWWLKLVDFWQNMMRWLKTCRSTETAVNFRVKMMNDNLMKAKQHLTSWRSLNKLGDRNLTTAYDEIQRLVLADPKLPKNKLTLMGFGPSPLNIEFDKQLRLVLAFTNNLNDIAKDLHDIVTGKGSAQVNVMFSGAVTEDAVKTLLKFAEASEDENYISDNLPQLDLYQPKYVMQRKLYYIEPFELNVKSLMNVLRGIRNVGKDLPPGVDPDRVMACINDITRGLRATEQVVELLMKLTGAYGKVTTTYLNYYIRCVEATREDIMDNFGDDLTRAAIEKAGKLWDEFLKTLGFV